METISKEKKLLIKRFHIALSNNGMMKQKPIILESFGVESTKQLDEAELQHVIDDLTGEADKWRKRVIAAIFGYSKTINMEYKTDTVKAVACRAAGHEKFNSIPVSRLRDIYFEFVRKTKTIDNSRDFKAEQIEYLKNRN